MALLGRILAWATAAFAMLGAASCASPESEDTTLPSTVVVAFDADSVTPLIVEGLADRTTGREVAANDPVRIASISKLLMALATLKLVEEGVVDLDRDVSDYLGWQLRAPGYPDTPVTLRQLLEHRSGLRDNAGYVIALGESLEDKLSDPAVWYADAAPGEAPFAYANIGSAVVATVLEAASGERYDALLDRIVFDPLDIDACANWIGCDAETIERAVVLYRDTGEVAADDASRLPPNCTVPIAEGTPCDVAGYVPGTNASIFSPQGGVRIGMVDLARIGQALANGGGGLVEETTLDAWFASASPLIEGQEFFCNYGYGAQRIEVEGRECMDFLFEDGRARIGHPGEAYGLRSGLWFDPETGTGMAYFISAVPSRQGAEDEGGFDLREIALIARAKGILAKALR